MRKPLLIAKTGTTFKAVRDTHGDFDAWFVKRFERLGVECRVIAVHEGAKLPPVQAVRGVVVTGSPAMVTDQEPWSEGLAAWLREAAEQLVPVLGVCYGHQLLAHALGGEVGYHPQGREIGTRLIRLHPTAMDDLLLGSLPESICVHLTHAQSVRRLPPQAVHLASNDYEPHQAFRVGEHVWGVQFHPEFNAEIMQAYVRTFWDRLLDEGRDPQALLDEVEETPFADAILERFATLLK
jgi:GMP synthase (glutamine-hydrolysing)